MATDIDNRLTPTQVALRLQVSSARVRQLALAGVIPSTMTGLGRLFDSDAVDQYIRERGERRTDARWRVEAYPSL
jgi:excisionase family DNA binding protein